MSEQLDRIDLRMLRLLQGNGRLSNAELAKLVAVSPATCHRRTQRLFEKGYIGGVRATVAPRKVERGALVIVGVVLALAIMIGLDDYNTERPHNSLGDRTPSEARAAVLDNHKTAA